MKKTLLLLTLASITLTSCAPMITFHSGTFSAPNLNETVISELGNAIYTSEDVVYRNAVRIDQLPTERIFFGKYSYNVGDIIPESGETKNHKVYSFYNEVVVKNGMHYRSSNSTKHGMYGIVVNKQTQKAYPSEGTTNSPQVDKAEGLIVSPAKYVEIDCEKCFKKEFIYNGKSNNTLKFVYREYIQDMARPAFSQELQYDLNESNIIGFKGLRIEVLKSTNTSIEYKVLSDLTN